MPCSQTKVETSAQPVPPRPPIEGPSAWVGVDMRGREAEWTYRLSPTKIVEIETAVQAVQARGLEIADIRREDFPLPTLGRAGSTARGGAGGPRLCIVARHAGRKSADRR